ncbi:MAG: hypothetical protein WB239_05295 [Acidimicrobiia bacterium]
MNDPTCSCGHKSTQHFTEWCVACPNPALATHRFSEPAIPPTSDQFWVVAGHIQLGSVDYFGPYLGPPTLTYENLRQRDENGPPFEIFSWFDFEDVKGELNPWTRAHGTPPDGWTDNEGNTRYYGWRRLEHVNTGKGYGHSNAVGPWYTDLILVSEDPNP